jgi:predicted ATP-dependent serine protease
MLQIMSDLAEKYKVFYVSGEESARQIKLRADRWTWAKSHAFIPGKQHGTYPRPDRRR